MGQVPQNHYDTHTHTHTLLCTHHWQMDVSMNTRQKEPHLTVHWQDLWPVEWKKKSKIRILITFLFLMAAPSACTMKIDRFSALNNIILWSTATQNKYGHTIMSQFLLWNEPQMTPIVVEMPSIHTMTLYPTQKQYTSTQKYSTQNSTLLVHSTLLSFTSHA